METPLVHHHGLSLAKASQIHDLAPPLVYSCKYYHQYEHINKSSVRRGKWRSKFFLDTKRRSKFTYSSSIFALCSHWTNAQGLFKTMYPWIKHRISTSYTRKQTPQKEQPSPHLILAFGKGINHHGGYLIHQSIRLPRVKDPCKATHVGPRPAPHLPVPVVHYPRLPLAVERVRRRERDVEPLRGVGAGARPVRVPTPGAAEELARPVPVPAVHGQEVVGHEEASHGDEDEQPGGGPAGILPPAHPCRAAPQHATRGGAPLLLSSRAGQRWRGTTDRGSRRGACPGDSAG